MAFSVYLICFVLPIILVCMIWWYNKPAEMETDEPHERLRVVPDVSSGQGPRAMPVQCQTQEQEEDLHAIYFQELDEDHAALRTVFEFQMNTERAKITPYWQELHPTREGEIHKLEWLTCSCIEEKIERDGQMYPPKGVNLDYPDRIEYWFHGTDEESALSIINTGIQLGKGYNKQDFSHGDGFYVNPSFIGARKWACIKTRSNKNQPAVIVFKLKGGLGQSGSVLNVSHPYGLWETLINYYRSGKEYIFNIKVEHLVSLYDCIYGPMYNRNSSYKRWGFDKPHRQLCIRKRALAEKFSQISSIDGLILWPAGEMNS